MEWNLRVGGARVCVEGQLRWHPGYFHPSMIDIRPRSFIRSISDQTPSPTCIAALYDESIFLKEQPQSLKPNRSSSSSPNVSRLSHSTCVSDSSASSASSSNASASGDKLRRRRKYRKKRSIKRRNPAQSKSPKEGSSSQAESPSAVYCEEWIYSSANVPSENKRITFAGFSDTEFSDNPNERRRSLGEGDSDHKRNTSWLHIWQNLLKITPKLRKKAKEPVAIEINPSHARKSILPSISEAEGGQSETQSAVSLDHPYLTSSSASGSVTACNTESNPTNQEVCLYDLSRVMMTWPLFFEFFEFLFGFS